MDGGVIWHALVDGLYTVVVVVHVRPSGLWHTRLVLYRTADEQPVRYRNLNWNQRGPHPTQLTPSQLRECQRVVCMWADKLSNPRPWRPRRGVPRP